MRSSLTARKRPEALDAIRRCARHWSRIRSRHRRRSACPGFACVRRQIVEARQSVDEQAREVRSASISVGSSGFADSQRRAAEPGAVDAGLAAHELAAQALSRRADGGATSFGRPRSSRLVTAPPTSRFSSSATNQREPRQQRPGHEGTSTQAQAIQPRSRSQPGLAPLPAALLARAQVRQGRKAGRRAVGALETAGHRRQAASTMRSGSSLPS